MNLLNKLLFFLIILSTSIQSTPSLACSFEIEKHLNLSLNNISSLASHIDCLSISKISTSEEFEKTVLLIIKEQEEKIKKYQPEDRHKVGGLFNACHAENNNKGLVINFEGTGSYEPRLFHLQQKLLKCLKINQLDPSLKKYLYYNLRKIYLDKVNPKGLWSALSAGPLNELMKNDDIRPISKNLQYVSFPSEESELLVAEDGFSLSKLKKLPSELYSSSAGTPRGIENAITCLKKYLKSAADKNISPKIIVQGHSSGSRSIVKFLELIKNEIDPRTQKKEIKVDLVFTIDPVVEAHEAAKEVLSQKAGNVARDLWRNVDDSTDENKLLTVWSKKRPNELYKVSNSLRWVSVYQNVDTDGLKKGLKFGIHGSPIEKADINQYIKSDLGSSAHGEIGINKKTTELYKTEIINLFK